MKILKYLFLLVLLAFVGIAVFIATQKSTFASSKSIYIKLPRNLVYTYLNDYKNWEQWESWKEDDASIHFNYDKKTSGQGASYSWSGKNSNGTSTTTSVTENEQISLSLRLNDDAFKSNLLLKDTLSGTQVTWKADGNVSFYTKISATLSGGINKYFDNIFERSLNNLNTVLTKEINNFKINVNGMVSIPPRYFVKSTMYCKPNDLQLNIKSGVAKIKFFFKNNNIKMNGKPFVVIESHNSDSIKLNVYGPLKEEIFISEGSDLTAGLMEGFTALKVTLIGDYTHLEKAKLKARQTFLARKLQPSATILPMEVYFTTVEDNKRPSKWVTFIQLPVYTKPIIVPKKTFYKPKKVDQIDKPEVEKPKNADPINEEF